MINYTIDLNFSVIIFLKKHYDFYFDGPKTFLDF